MARMSLEEGRGMGVVRHVVDRGGETGWLQRLTGFQQKEIRRQAHFKWHHWPGLDDGAEPGWPGEKFPHFLPAGHERDVFYAGHADAILAYAEKRGIPLGERVLDLCDARVACFNLFFELRRDPDWAASVLEPLLPGVTRLQDVHFDYWGPEPVADWLGERPDGLGRTGSDVDVAFAWLDRDGRRCLTLAEWTYTESTLGECDGFNSEANRQRERCKNLIIQHIQPAVDCYLETRTGPRTMRRYWERLVGAGIELGEWIAVRGCPFRGALSPLMRRTLLAAALREQQVADWVELVVVGFEHNRGLLAVPRELKSLSVEGNVIDTWNSVLAGVPPVRYLAVERILQEVDRVGGVDPDWRRYLRERYGL